MGVLCYCLVTIKKLAVFRCKYNSKNATICYVLFFKSKFYSSLFLIKDDIAKLKIFLRKLRPPKSIYFGFGIFFLQLYHHPGAECVVMGEGAKTASWWIKAENCNKLAGLWRDMAEMRRWCNRCVS